MINYAVLQLFKNIIYSYHASFKFLQVALYLENKFCLSLFCIKLLSYCFYYFYYYYLLLLLYSDNVMKYNSTVNYHNTMFLITMVCVYFILFFSESVYFFTIVFKLYYTVLKL